MMKKECQTQVFSNNTISAWAVTGCFCLTIVKKQCFTVQCMKCVWHASGGEREQQIEVAGAASRA